MSTTDSYAVPPEVWDAIVPEARATDARESRVTAWVVIAAVVLVGASWFATSAGLFGPRLDLVDLGSSGDSGTHTGTITLDIRNVGWPATRVTGAHILSPLGSRVQVTAVHLTPEFVAGRASGKVEIAYTITDCDAYRSYYGEEVPTERTDSDAIELDATTWWGGTRQVPLRSFGAVGDLLAAGCLPR